MFWTLSTKWFPYTKYRRTTKTLNVVIVLISIGSSQTMGNLCFSCLTALEERNADNYSHTGASNLGSNVNKVGTETGFDYCSHTSDVKKDGTMDLKDLTGSAAKGDDVKLRYFIHKGANLNSTDRHGQTALFYASFGGFYKCVDSLIKAGTDVNIVNNQDVTPMMAAGDPGNVKCVQLLLKAGARVNIRDKSNLNALERYIQLRNGRNETFLRLLFAAGEEDSSFQSGQNSYLDIPEYADYGFANHSLKHVCRLMIRKHLLSLDSTNLFLRIPKLDLPSFLVEYLLYDVELDFDTLDSMLNEMLLKHEHVFKKLHANIPKMRPK